ncbi:glycosyltransferase family 4 protein [Sinomonas sp. P47F7]|uniref:glycosyltransferase family 4 protein n=1 Tax=Sinomonas sp. P47F7 TaxID=3410987 RepID=UPI003BF5F48B
MTGVQRFAEQIIRTLAAQREDLVFVAPRGFTPSEAGYPVEAIGRLRGHAWEQIDLPAYLHRSGSPLLLNLMSTAPVFYRNKVMTAHDITYIRHPESFSRAFRMFYGVAVPPALRRSRKILTVSEFSRREISACFGLDSGAFAVVPNAVDGQFAPRSSGSVGSADEGPRYLLAVSSPNRHKNFENLIAAYLRSGLHPSVGLTLVGSRNRSFRDTGVTSGATLPGVTFAGRVSDEHLIRLYQGATAFVFPSLYEGFGIPVLEAQAAGAPVLAANRASLPEVLQDSAILFDPLNVDQIAARMVEVVSSEQLRHQLREKGLANAARFSWKNSARIVSDLLDGLSTGSPTTA